MNGYTDAALAGYYAPGPDPCETPHALYPTKQEGITSAADVRHAALAQRVETLERRVDMLIESLPLRTLPATKAAELAAVRQRLDGLVEQVLALQAHVQMQEGGK